MPIDANNLVARAREHLTEQDEAVKYGDERFHALIPSATAEWIRRTENDSKKRANFLAESERILIRNGVADCFEKLEAKGIQSQFVPTGDILIENSAAEVKFCASLSRLKLGGIQDKFFLTAYFDGKRMYFRNPVDSSLTTFTGAMRIRAVSVPQTLEEIPISVEGELASILAEIIRKFDTDREHKGVSLNMRQPR